MRPDPVETILDSIADGVFTVDRDWRVTFFNRAAERITGVAKEEAIDQPCFDVFRASICQTSCALKRTLETGKEVIDLAVDILDADGRRVPISVSTAALRGPEGKIIGGVETFRDLSAVEELRKELEDKYSFEDIISKNHAILKIFDILPDIAESESTVLIQGPSGSGKELFARAIHHLGPRGKGPYVVVSCGAIPDTLLESELFGYVRGAFTHATRDKPGRFALAEGGTLFLDEIGDVSPAVQVKLLRVLEEKEYEPLGSTATRKADVRIVAASNRDLRQMVDAGQFREDLYYRLNVVKIELPPLRQRREDIPLLVAHFIHSFNLKMGKSISGVSSEVMDLFMKHDFPGNVRELENALEHGCVVCRGTQIEREHLPREMAGQAEERGGAPGAPPFEKAEAQVIIDALRRHGGHRGRAAAELGIHTTTLWRKMKRLGITTW
ncbi:Fis family transcriptional regulator [candidate division TA06 bacterium DG_24]|uniref:Fis family transcriptional regulator n=2 Tax=Bacteria division TA06 TaxID=1156500 RepID=A0A0S8JHN2_UNCT6|nr:MAG: Fis family transcriptional regulator [candidate division TA06 bacterium DG_24]KPL09239.1 MAG: Fis family transcriptional regulator [candidate division TA06 bacterium SM1_40]